MPDFLTTKQRSVRMSAIRGRNNKTTELVLAAVFRRNKINGWRRRYPVYGRPDFVFPKLKLAVFVDGCFWHSCPKHSHIPGSNRAFWREKFSRNKSRDQLVTRTLRSKGWRVLRIWEHELTRKHEARCISRIRRALSLVRRS
jgi:DNA mismatch endonuclease, patch repair protein